MGYRKRSGWDAFFAMAPLPVLLLFTIPYLIIIAIGSLSKGISESFSNHYEKSKNRKQNKLDQIKYIRSQPSVNTKYIGNKTSATFHYPACKWAKQTGQKNIVRFQNRNDAIKKMMKPCRFCKP